MGGVNLRLIKGQKEDSAVQATDPDAPRQRRKLPRWSKWLLASAAISSAAVITLCSTKIVDLTPEPPKPMPPKEETCNPAVRNSPTAFVFAAKLRHDINANSERIKAVLGSNGSDVVAHAKVTLSPNGAVDYRVLAYSKGSDRDSSADVTNYISINKDSLVFPAPGTLCTYHVMAPLRTQ